MSYQSTATQQPEGAVRTPEVVLETQELEADIQYIDKLLAELEQRIEPILQPPVPQQAGSVAQETQPEPGAAHAREIHRLRGNAKGISSHLRYILSRVEI